MRVGDESAVVSPKWPRRIPACRTLGRLWLGRANGKVSQVTIENTKISGGHLR
jgi:hypothetical protein